MLVRDGGAPRPARSLCGAGADFSLYQHEKHMLGHEYQNWIAFGTVAPCSSRARRVPVIWVYEDPRIRRARLTRRSVAEAVGRAVVHEGVEKPLHCSIPEHVSPNVPASWHHRRQ